MEQYIQKNKELKRNVGITIIVVFVLSLIPLLLISKYAHSSADDYAYGLFTAQAWIKTHSVFETLLSAVQQAQTSYATWQGTLSATFLMALQPAVFGEKYYILTPIILMLSYMIATLLFLKAFLVNHLKADKYNFAIISFLILILSIQFMYAPVEGFFWYNGGIYYTFFYSLSLILFSLILFYLKSKNPFARTLYSFISMVLGLFIGAGNYTTALTTVLILFFITVYHLIQKNKRVVILTLILMSSLIGLIVSVMAPGNSMRQASVGQPNAIKAIILSFAYGAYSVCNSTTVPIIIAWLFMTPLIYKIARDSEYSFQHPLLFAALSFCIYCAQVTPPFYALGLSLPERLIDIVYYSYYILILLNILYVCGWISKKFGAQEFNDKSNLRAAVLEMRSAVRRYETQIVAAMAALFVCGTIGMCAVSKGFDGKPQINHLPTSVSAVQSLLNGDAKTYDAEVNQRISAYQDASKRIVQVKDYSVKPYLLYYNDIVEDQSDWRNKLVAQYYGKESVKLDLTK